MLEYSMAKKATWFSLPWNLRHSDVFDNNVTW